MAANENAALRLAHPTVVPGTDADDQEASDPTVDATGPHPTVRTRGD